MRITFQQSFDDSMRDLAEAAERLARAQRQVSSGRRVNAPSDDPTAVAASIREHAMVSTVDAYVQSTDAASSRLAVADSTLSDMTTQLTAAKVAATAARGSGRTQAQRDTYSGEILAVRDSLLNDISTKFGATYLFSGTADSAPYAALPGGGFTGYLGDTVAQTVNVADGHEVRLSFDGSALFQGADPVHILDALTTLADAVRLGNDAGIQAGLDAIDRAFDRVSNAHMQVGIAQRSIEDIKPQLEIQRVAATTRISKLEDADMAAAISEMASADTAQQAALRALASLNHLTLMDYLK